LSGSTLILTSDSLKINFLVAQVVHTKSEDLGNLAEFKLWPELLPIIFSSSQLRDAQGVHVR
jgi:hypothetical protein